jgi:peptide/nickel transport system permease protein
MAELAHDRPDRRGLLVLRFIGEQTLRAFNANVTSWIGLGLFVLVVLCAVFAPLLAPHDPIEQDILSRLQGPSSIYPLGTDNYGRDILSRLLYGARISLWISVAAVLLATLIGGSIGLLAGYFGGRFDLIVMQAMDVLLALPSLILGLILVAMLGPSMTNLIIAIAVGFIPAFARIARSPTIAIKQRDYIEAGRALGFSDPRLMGLHILPNIVPQILVMSTMWLASAIRIEASLAFLGLGATPPTPTWGGMIQDGFEHILDSAWLCIWPSLAILTVVFALNLMGDGLRDAIDPRLREES